MKVLIRTVALLNAVGMLVACGDRTMAEESTPPPRPPDMGAPAESEGASEGEVICREGLTACEGECVDLSSDDEHCGVCGHVCQQASRFGHCLEGSCASAWFCGGVDQGLVTCEDVCMLHGQVCDDGPAMLRGCGGGSYRLHFDHDALERCEIGLGAATALEATCATPIDWSIEGGWEDGTARAVSCCCTQDLPP